MLGGELCRRSSSPSVIDLRLSSKKSLFPFCCHCSRTHRSSPAEQRREVPLAASPRPAPWTPSLPRLDSFSFTDIERSSVLSRDEHRRSHSKSSSVTTDLSTYSSQGLLRKLREKAQVLDEQYKRISSPARPTTNERLSWDGSDREMDEDNVLRELIRFNNDIDLILARLDVDEETLTNTREDEQ